MTSKSAPASPSDRRRAPQLRIPVPPVSVLSFPDLVGRGTLPPPAQHSAYEFMFVRLIGRSAASKSSNRGTGNESANRRESRAYDQRWLFESNVMLMAHEWRRVGNLSMSPECFRCASSPVSDVSETEPYPRPLTPAEWRSALLDTVDVASQANLTWSSKPALEIGFERPEDISSHIRTAYADWDWLPAPSELEHEGLRIDSDSESESFTGKAAVGDPTPRPQAGPSRQSESSSTSIPSPSLSPNAGITTMKLSRQRRMICVYAAAPEASHMVQDNFQFFLTFGLDPDATDIDYVIVVTNLSFASEPGSDPEGRDPDHDGGGSDRVPVPTELTSLLNEAALLPHVTVLYRDIRGFDFSTQRDNPLVAIRRNPSAAYNQGGCQLWALGWAGLGWAAGEAAGCEACHGFC